MKIVDNLMDAGLYLLWQPMQESHDKCSLSVNQPLGDPSLLKPESRHLKVLMRVKYICEILQVIHPDEANACFILGPV